MPLILLDQDGPLADFDAAVHRVLDDAGYDSGRLVRTQWETSDDVRTCFGDVAAQLVDHARHQPGFYRDLPVVDGAVEGVDHLLAAGCDIVVCTSPSLRNPSCASDKIAWLAEHFPQLHRRFAVVKDKTLVRGDVLVDDKPDVTGALTPVWTHIRFVTAGNTHVTGGHVLTGWRHWTEVLRVVELHRRANNRHH